MKYLIGLLLVFSCLSFLYAGPEGRGTADTVFEDGGNRWRTISVTASTNTVLISTTPADSFLGIMVWRYREIVNTSTIAALALYPSNAEYTSFSSTFGIVLSSDSRGLGRGDSYVVPHQGEVWGAWSTGTGGQGAGGVETYWKK